MSDEGSRAARELHVPYHKRAGQYHKQEGVKTYYCLWQAVGEDLVFEVEVIDPEDEQGDV